MRLLALPVLATLAAGGCAAEREPQPWLLPAVRAVSFNIGGASGVSDPVIAPQLAAELTGLRPDFAALQECVACSLLLPLLAEDYAFASEDDSEVAILYDQRVWSLLDDDVLVLGLDDDGWGRREARRSRFRHRDSGEPLVVYSTHWCVTIRNDTDACDVARHLAYADQILDDVEARRDPAIVAGDLNVFDGFEDSAAIERLRERGMIDTLREVSDAPVVTFEGNDWAPPGRLDYIFTTAPIDVVDAAVASESVSDHRPVSTTVRFR